MLKRCALTLCAVAVSLAALAQTPQESELIERIKNDPSYYCGEGVAATEVKAKKVAMSDLANNISTTIVDKSSLIERHTNGSVDRTLISETGMTSNVTLNNSETVIYTDAAGDIHCFCYISVSDVDKAISERRERIVDLVEQGIRQEEQLNIAGALKYYNWALNMLTFYNDKVQLKVRGKGEDAGTWLPAKIKSVLDNVTITLDERDIDYDANDYDHYTANLRVTYGGKPVSAVDLRYFNGERQVPDIHAKNGIATLSFPRLDNFKSIDVSVNYSYADEAAVADNDIKTVYESSDKIFRADSRATTSLPVCVTAESIINRGRVADDTVSDAADAVVPDSVVTASVENSDPDNLAPIIRPERKQVARTMMDNPAALVDSMKKVENAIRTRDYRSAESCFTPDGYELFARMMKSGNIKVTSKDIDYTVETTNHFAIGRGIPVRIKKGRHEACETIVFRFDQTSGKIESVAYALTRRAESDIFRQAQWNMDSRYAQLKFMEDYQTAFALERYDYIESIFSDDAIIIVGSFEHGKSKRFVDLENGGNLGGAGRKVNYKHFNKAQYLDKLKRDFAVKDFINLTFEDNVISKAKTDGFLDHEVIWIEIKQHYVSSNYSDTGYLTLQINMKPSGSQINVRTWTPGFVDLDLLKTRYSIGKNTQQ